VLTGYFDDSGTHGNATVLLMGGLVGNESQWTAFELGWKPLLANPTGNRGPIRRFHAYELEHALGDFSGWNRADKDNAFFNFRKVIIDSGLRGYVMAVEIAPWDEHIKGPIRTVFGDAERFCVIQCIMKTTALALALDPNGTLNFVFDNRPESTEANQRVFKIFLTFNQSALDELPQLRDMAFSDSTSTLPLQGADLIAYEYYVLTDALVRRVNGGNPVEARAHWKRLSESGLIAGECIFANDIKALARDNESVTEEFAEAMRRFGLA
jgi:hypothetical protein